MQLKEVVPWGRSLIEYVKMFNLTEAELKRQLLDCGGGPASFNAQLTQAGGTVISCDPIYQFTQQQVQTRITETYPQVLAATQANQDKFIWQEIPSVEGLGRMRMESMALFLADFPHGLQQGRYRAESLPNLSFGDRQFNLALCSHLLFTYSEQLSLEFHINAILEMARVAEEVRIFPLITGFLGEFSPHVEPVTQVLASQGYLVKVESVSYEFQRGGNQLLRVQPQNHN